MFRIFVTIGGLIALILLSLFIVPFFIDWGEYKANFEQQASKIIGHKVLVKGKAKAKILPFPSLSFEEVIVHDEGREAPLLKVQKFSIFAELAPLLSGQLHIVDMVLENPQANVVLDEAQNLNWLIRNPTISDFDLHMDDVVLKDITVKNGSIKIYDKLNAHSHSLKTIDAKFSANSLIGPWHGKGQARYSANAFEEPFDFKIDTGAWLAENKKMRLRASIDLHHQPYGFKTTGTVDHQKAQLKYGGNFQFIPHQGLLLKTFQQKFPTANAPLPINLDGQIRASLKAIKIDDFNLKITSLKEPYRINGSADIEISKTPNYRIKAEGRQIDVARLHPKTLDNSKNSKSPNISFSSHLDNLQNLLNKLPNPPIEGKISLALPAITAGPNIIKTLKIAFSPQENGWQINNFEAELPGRTQMRAKGHLNFAKHFNFIGNMAVASSQPSGFANWIKGRIDPKIRAVKQAGFESDVTLNDTLMRFDNLEINLDGQSLIGNIVRRSSFENERPSLLADLEGKVLDLNAMQAVLAIFTKNTKGQNIIDHDIALTLKNDLIRYKDQSAKNVFAQLNLSQNDVEIKTLEIADLAGSKIISEGKINDIFNSPQGELQTSIKAQNLSNLLKIITANFTIKDSIMDDFFKTLTNNPHLSENAALALTVKASTKAEISDLKMLLNGSFSKTEFQSQINFKGNVKRPYEANLAFSANAQQSQSHILLEQLAMVHRPIGKTQIWPKSLQQAARFDFSFSGIPEQGMAVKGALNFAKNQSKINGILKFQQNDAPYFSFNTRLTAKRLDEIAYLVGIEPENLAEFKNQTGKNEDQVNLNFLTEGNFSKLSFRKISGKILGNQILGKIELDRSKTNRRFLNGNLEFSNVALPFLANLVYRPKGNLQNEASANPINVFWQGKSWPKSGFTTPLLKPYEGKLSIKAKGFDLGFQKNAAQDFEADLHLSKGDIALKNAKFMWHGKPISYSLIMQNADKRGALRLNLTAQDFEIGELLWHPQGKPLLRAKGNISLNLETSGDSPNAMVKGASGTLKLDLKGGRINYLDGKILEKLIPLTDKDDFKINNSAIKAMVESHFYKKPYVFESGPVEFTIAGGIARTSAIRLFDENSNLDGDVKFDLSKKTLLANGIFNMKTLLPVAGENSANIEFNVDGKFNAPKILVDTSPLTNFLALRAFEKQRIRIETLQADIAEKQFLDRSVLKLLAKAQERRRLEQEKIKLEQEAEKEAERKAEREAKIEAERESQTPFDEELTPLNEELSPFDEELELQNFTKTVEEKPLPPLSKDKNPSLSNPSTSGPNTAPNPAPNSTPTASKAPASPLQPNSSLKGQALLKDKTDQGGVSTQKTPQLNFGHDDDLFNRDGIKMEDLEREGNFQPTFNNNGQ